MKSGILQKNSGAVMLEFIVVMPLYLFMLGLLFIYGEVVLFNNRVLQMNRILAYANISDQIIKDFIIDVHNGVSLFNFKYIVVNPDYPANGGYNVTETDFAKLNGTYSYVEDISLPSGIQGLLLLPAILENPGSAATKYPKFSLGYQAETYEYLMHWTVKRYPEWYKHNGRDVRRQMGKVAGSIKNCDSLRYYKQAAFYFSDAFSATMPYPVTMTSNDENTSAGPNYDFDLEITINPRIFGTFFTDGDRR